MKGLIPFGSMTISGPGAGTILLGAAGTLLNLWSAAGGANGPAGTSDDGDPAVWPDNTNNRMRVGAPGVYWVKVVLSGVPDAAQDIVMQLAKNGVAIGDMVTRQRWTNAVKNTQILEGYVNITAADNPGNIANKPAVDASAGPGKPQGGFGGGGGFPSTELPITLLLSSLAGTPTLTIEFAQFMMERRG